MAALTAEAGALPPQGEAASAMQGEERREGNRRRRGRRGRGGSGGERAEGAAEGVRIGDETGAGVEAPLQQPPQVAPIGAVPVDVDAIPLQVQQVPEPAPSEVWAPPAIGLPPAPLAVREAVADAPIAEPARESLPERAAEVAAPAMPVAATTRPRNLPDIPPITLALPLESGLELVQTTSRPAEPLEEPAPQPRPKRVRAPRPVVADEPLQIVETRREDGTPPPA